jgi:hypothetical protein
MIVDFLTYTFTLWGAVSKTALHLWRGTTQNGGNSKRILNDALSMVIGRCCLARRLW